MQTMPKIECREVKDMPTLLAWRKEVIRHVFGEEPSSSLMLTNEKYYESHIADGSHLAVVATGEDGEEMGCGSICFDDELPSPDNPSGRCAYLMNIYVREPFRSHGVGHAIVSFLIERARERDCGKIYLETTADGRPLYTSLGFKDMADMMKLS